jgi:hypothetical protein
MSTDSVVVSKEAFSVTVDGVDRVVRKGETFSSGHPLVRKYPTAFAAFVVDNVWETTSAAPGEKRTARPKGTSKRG